jgi:SAM-dependent methyltransferase
MIFYSLRTNIILKRITEGVLDAYTYLSKAYDKLMSDVDYTEWAAYLDVFLKNNGVKYIFEAACGTGKATKEFYKLGYDITAADISPEMLTAAIENARHDGYDIKYVRQDMRFLKVGKKADAVISVCDGPNYIDINGFKDFTSSAYEALKDGGLLLFDISTRVKLKKMNNEVYFDDGEDVSCIWQNTYDSNVNILKMDVTLFLKKGDLFERFTETHVQYAHDVDELKSIIKSAGFKKAEAYDFMTTDVYKGKSDRAQFICLK